MEPSMNELGWRRNASSQLILLVADAKDIVSF